MVREGFIKADLKNEVSLQKMRWKAEGQSHEVPQAEGSFEVSGIQEKVRTPPLGGSFDSKSSSCITLRLNNKGQQKGGFSDSHKNSGGQAKF